jgi:ATP-binding cassette subfamily A (ABC1) protein 3
VWHYKIFTGTNVFLVLIIHLLLGLVLASHSLLIAVPFGKSPQLAAVMSTIVAIASAVIPFAGKLGTGSAVIYSLFLPGGFYTYAIRCIAAWELQNIPTNALKLSPQPYSDSKDPQLMLLPLLVVALVCMVVSSSRSLV